MGSVKKVVVLDYGSGNLRSAERALASASVPTSPSPPTRRRRSTPTASSCRAGRFRRVHGRARAVDGPRIIGRRLAGGRRCWASASACRSSSTAGSSTAHDAEGCGEWPGVVEPLKAPILPHMGWNTVSRRARVLFDGLADERFYFVHSYGVRDGRSRRRSAEPARQAAVTWAEHGDRFVAGVENGPLSATQFHPEKAGTPAPTC